MTNTITFEKMKVQKRQGRSVRKLPILAATVDHHASFEVSECPNTETLD